MDLRAQTGKVAVGRMIQDGSWFIHQRMPREKYPQQRLNIFSCQRWCGGSQCGIEPSHVAQD